MSFTNANIIKLATNKTPILIECSRKFSETGEPLTFSIAIISNCPPSKTGMGNKFIRPRLILNIAIIDKKDKSMRDFIIHTEKDHNIPGLINLYGIESPGLTSSLSLASYITKNYE